MQCKYFFSSNFAVFQSGDQIFYWYLLLSGEVQLFLSTAEVSFLKMKVYEREIFMNA